MFGVTIGSLFKSFFYSDLWFIWSRGKFTFWQIRVRE